MKVDLRSDTVTRPTEGMLRAMASAEVGDDVFGDDPSVNRLQAMAAELSGKEAALFVPSGTMANQIAIALHTRPGDEVVMEGGAHPFNYEAGGAALISGVQVRPIPGQRGILRADDVETVFRGDNPHFSPVTLVCVEDTANRGGGAVWPVSELDAVAAAAHEQGAATHMDGARVFNAVVHSGVDLARRIQGYDTLSFCLSKGLGCPVGSLLCGPGELIARGIRVRKALGGGMRQAGFLAACGIYALENHIERLAEDHTRAARLAELLMTAGFEVGKPQTNMVYLGVADAPAARDALAERGVAVVAVGPTTLRLVTHLDVDDAGIDVAAQALVETCRPG